MLHKSVYYDKANIYYDKASMCLAALEVRYFTMLLLMYKTTENIFQFQMCTLNHATFNVWDLIFSRSLSPLEPIVMFILMKLGKVKDLHIISYVSLF